METSSKERLTGALLVVLALVILAPELLSGRRTAERGTPPAQNPEDGAPLQTYDVQLDGSGAAPVAPRDVPAAAAAEIAAVPPPVTEAPAPATAAAPPAPQQQEQPAAPADNRQAQGKPGKKPAADAVETPAPAGKWWVSLGVFASRDNAQQLASKLRAAGFTIDVSQGSSKGKELFRVRAGPVVDRVTASALQARLAAAGQKDLSLVSP